MSIELRREQNRLVCDWGSFDNGEADPKHGLRHLLLTTEDYVTKLLDEGQCPGPRGGIHSASRVGDRLFAHVDHDGKRWTWELFDAHWWDHGEPSNVLVGRWPD